MRSGTPRCLDLQNWQALFWKVCRATLRSEMPHNLYKSSNFMFCFVFLICFLLELKISHLPLVVIPVILASNLANKTCVTGHLGFITIWQMRELKLRALNNVFNTVSDRGRACTQRPWIWVCWSFPNKEKSRRLVRPGCLDSQIDLGSKPSST